MGEKIGKERGELFNGLKTMLNEKNYFRSELVIITDINIKVPNFINIHMYGFKLRR